MGENKHNVWIIRTVDIGLVWQYSAFTERLDIGKHGYRKTHSSQLILVVWTHERLHGIRLFADALDGRVYRCSCEAA